MSYASLPDRTMKTIDVLLTIIGLLLIIGCSGGGNGDSDRGGGIDINRDEGMDIPTQAEWSIIPFTQGLSIQWHNLGNFSRVDGPQRVSISFMGSDPSVEMVYIIAMNKFVDGIYNLTGLIDGMAYRFATTVALEYSNNVLQTRPIKWLWELNELDNAGDGIMVGEDYDKDGRANRVDDDDNDEVVDGDDGCPTGWRNWHDDGTNDVDGDGCRNDEDIDDDGDGLIEIATAWELDAVHFVLNGSGLKQDTEAMLDQAGCGDGVYIRVCSGYELVRDISLTDYIAERYPTAGWRPIAPDMDGNDIDCDGDKFTAIFDGNSFEVSGLVINRSKEDCIGLFGQVNGTIRHLGVVADRIIGRNFVGSLVGYGVSLEVIQSYGVSNAVNGGDTVGGLVGFGGFASIIQSYSVSGEVSGGNTVGGLVGWGDAASIVQSYSVSGEVSGGNTVGGLVGWGDAASIMQSYGVSSEVSGTGWMVGGLVGYGENAEIVQSYAVSGEVNGNGLVGGLVGFGGNAHASYWDIDTSGRTNSGAGSGRTGMALRSPTNYTLIYDIWDDGWVVEGMDNSSTIWCDEDLNGVIEDEERRGNDHIDGDNRVWDFGTDTDYPAIRCTPNSLADQRAWWSLNATGKPELNTTLLDDWLAGTLP